MTDSLSLKARKKTEEFILKGVLRAGDKITERDLAERLGMSRAPVREAIRELIGVGLLEQISTRQIVVRQLLLSEVKEIFSIRAMLEGKAAATAATRFQTQDLMKLEQLHEQMKRVASSNDLTD
jgi:DNA-binding GntR family transcriptional regulator